MRHARENQKREWSIEVLRRLGWNKGEIGEAMGLTGQRVGQLMKEIPTSAKLSKTQLVKGAQIEVVAEANNLPLVLATALDLDPFAQMCARVTLW